MEFRRFLDAIDAAVPPELDVHLVLDNYSTHKSGIIWNWLAKRPRFYVHFTPTSGSWLNLVERWFAELTTKQLRRAAHRSVAQLEAAIQEFIDAHHADPKPFVWTKSAVEILASIGRLAERTVTHTDSPTYFANHWDGTLAFADPRPVAPADPSHVRWVSHCRNLVQLPVAA